MAVNFDARGNGEIRVSDQQQPSEPPKTASSTLDPRHAEQLFAGLPERLQEWVRAQGDSSRIESIAMAHDAQRLAQACQDLASLDRLMSIASPIIDHDSGFTISNPSNFAASVIRRLTEELLPKPVRISDHAWATTATREKVDHVSQRIREVVGSALCGYYSEADLLFIADNLKGPDFQLLESGSDLRMIDQFAATAVSMLCENPVPVVFKFNSNIVVVERDPVTGQPPPIGDIVSAYMSRVRPPTAT